MGARAKHSDQAHVGSPLSSATIALEVDLVLISERSEQQAIYLGQAGGPRRLVFRTGVCEASAINWVIRGVQTARPFVHSMVANLVKAFGGTVVEVLVADFIDGVFDAKIRIAHGAGTLEIGARLSDAVALAIVTNVPILLANRAADRALYADWPFDGT
jgi:uncharacterized protein